MLHKKQINTDLMKYRCFSRVRRSILVLRGLRFAVISACYAHKWISRKRRLADKQFSVEPSPKPAFFFAAVMDGPKDVGDRGRTDV